MRKVVVKKDQIFRYARMQSLGEGLGAVRRFVELRLRF
jgi:hypothetical protein